MWRLVRLVAGWVRMGSGVSDLIVSRLGEHVIYWWMMFEESKRGHGFKNLRIGFGVVGSRATTKVPPKEKIGVCASS
jgi:hypothetical protein